MSDIFAIKLFLHKNLLNHIAYAINLNYAQKDNTLYKYITTREVLNPKVYIAPNIPTDKKNIVIKAINDSSIGEPFLVADMTIMGGCEDFFAIFPNDIIFFKKENDKCPTKININDYTFCSVMNGTFFSNDSIVFHKVKSESITPPLEQYCIFNGEGKIKENVPEIKCHYLGGFPTSSKSGDVTLRFGVEGIHIIYGIEPLNCFILPWVSILEITEKSDSEERLSALGSFLAAGSLTTKDPRSAALAMTARNSKNTVTTNFFNISYSYKGTKGVVAFNFKETTKKEDNPALAAISIINQMKIKLYGESVPTLNDPSTPPHHSDIDPLDTIGKLKTLLDSGALTQAEFEEQKSKLLKKVG